MMGAKTFNTTKTMQQQSIGIQQSSCIVCTNIARHSSIYCSDDCIRKHANTTTNNIAAQSDNTSTTAIATSSLSAINTTEAHSSSSSMKWIAPIESNQHNRVDVYEKKSGRCLTGNSAPTVDNLRQWLQSHPTFEVVQNGSQQAIAIKMKKLQNQLNMAERDSQPKVVQTTLNVAPNKRVILVNPHKQATKAPVPQQLQQPQQAVVLKTATPKVIVKGPKEVPLFVTTKQRGSSAIVVATPAKLTQPAKQTTPAKHNPSAKQTPPGKLTPPVKPPSTNIAGTTKRKSDQNHTSTNPKSSGSTEPIRVTVQKTLREQLTLRMAETTDVNCPKLSAEEITRFAADTEREIYLLFNRDTTSKYRAKYRSLMFNIKDRKNETLFRKICDTSIQPKQLVRLSAEDLASQELAQWRENENKHQLEMIKKSELDMLACPKSYVLKTHKGEEVIENKTSDRVSLDPSTSVRDVVSMLNNSTVSSTSEHIDELLHTPAVVKDTRIDSRFEKYLSVDSSSSGGAQAAGSSRSSLSSVVLASSATKKKTAKRSRSRSREREQLDAKKTSSSASKHKRKRSRDRRSRSRSTDKDHRSDKTKKDEKRNKDKVDPSKVQKADTPKPTVAASKDPPKPLKKEENFNLIDKILEAQSTIDRILRPEETAKKETVAEKKTSDIAPATDESLSATQISNESDQEPTSTVTIPTPPESFFQLSTPPSAVTSDSDDEPVWSGIIIMVDVTTFQIAIRPLAGDFSDIIDDLPVELDVVGRIRPDIVWDYISKIKKSPYKEILVLRFGAAIDEDSEAYATFYTYLASRQRFGVIKTKSSTIKDFYLLPLAAHKSLPSVLQPLDRFADFDKDRPDLLLGIIVKNRTVPLKRALSTPHRSHAGKVGFGIV